LIVLGPEKLPGAARTAGALLRRLRSGWDDVRSEVERELEVEEIRRAAREAAAQAEAAQQEIRDGLQHLHEPLAEVVGQVGAMEPRPTEPVVVAPTLPESPESLESPESPETNPQAELPLEQPPPVEAPAAGSAAGKRASARRNTAHDGA
jgi:sec-independent protein translocase protein TatB